MFTCRSCGVEQSGRPDRVFCNNACQRQQQRRTLLENWLTTGVGVADSHAGHYIRVHLYAEQCGECAICRLSGDWNGSDLVLILDHVDGNASDNRRENLRLVCPNCDSQLPTYKNRNVGRGRHSRRERYAAGQSF